MRTLRTFLTAVVMTSFGFGSAVSAADNPVVVELYTSQGCSSCPPADEILAELGKRDNIIALALHVDYWDYIGWKDPFANPAFTERQKGYARTFRSRTIYTPQMVINGTADVIGNRTLDVGEAVQKHSQDGMVVPLSLTRSDDALTIQAPAQQGLGNADVILIRYKPEETVSIPRGENAGRSITYSHIVTEWNDIGDWNGRQDLSAKVDLTGDAPVVVLVQGKDQGAILAAARLR